MLIASRIDSCGISNVMSTASACRMTALASRTVRGRDGDIVVDVPDDGSFPVVADEADADGARDVRAHLDLSGADAFPGQRGKNVMPGSVVAHDSDRGHLGAEPGQCYRLVERLPAGRGADGSRFMLLAPAWNAGCVHQAVEDISAHHGEAQVLGGPLPAVRQDAGITRSKPRRRQR